MKKSITLFTLLLVTTVYSQVGIGTTTPREALDVNGNILIDGSLILNAIAEAANADDLLVRSINSNPIGEIKILNVDTRLVAPVNKYKVIVKNVSANKVTNLSTNLPVDKYVVAITDAVFKNANPTVTSLSSTTSLYGAYSTEVTTNGTNYGVNLAFQGQDATTLQTGYTAGQWELSLIVYEKSLVKIWPNVNSHVSATNNPSYSGESTTTPDALK